MPHGPLASCLTRTGVGGHRGGLPAQAVPARRYGRDVSARQNRVAPTGEIVAIPLRGSWMGNRGILHDDAGRVVRNHASNLWITCALEFRGWRAEQWQPHHYTVLFFHDEAVSLAAATARVRSAGEGRIAHTGTHWPPMATGNRC